MKKKTPRQSLTEKCDDQFSINVRVRKEECEMCGKPGYLHKQTGRFINGLQCAHIEERIHKVLRWDYRNARVLCEGCHKFKWHADSAIIARQAQDWFINRWPEDWEYIQKTSQTVIYPDEVYLADLLVRLKEDYQFIR